LRDTDAKHCPACGAELRAAEVAGRTRKRCGVCAFVLYLNPASAAAGVVLDEEGRVLLVRRARPPFEDAWALPAGYQEQDEEPRECLRREVREEAGLEVEPYELFDLIHVVDPRRPANVAVFLCRAVGGRIEAGDEASDARWFALDELPGELAFDNGPLLSRVAAHHDVRARRERAERPSPGGPSLTSEDARVEIDAAVRALADSKAAIRRTFTPGVVSDIGLFGGLFDLAAVGASDQLLVASADGVGSKLEIARRAGVYDTVGRDLVQHCIDDVLVQGARPLFFMDYVGVGVLEPDVVSALIRGCAAACEDEGLALLGGETAEMPGLYAPGDFDLVGFVVGAVERSKLLDGRRVRSGQELWALPSTGLHTNGYSLARRIVFDVLGLDVHDRPPELEGRSVAEALLAPHRSYLRPLWPLLEENRIAALAHITGGGLVDNLPRVLGAHDACIERDGWPVPPVFRWLCDAGGVAPDERFRVFNMGVGMVLFVDGDQVGPVRSHFEAQGEPAYPIGRVTEGRGVVRFEPREPA